MILGRIRAVLATAAASACLLGPGCTTAPKAAAWDRELADAEARWHAAGLSNYTFGLLRTCSCVADQVRPVVVTVRAGAFAHIAFTDSLGGVPDTTLFQQFLTMDRYFALLQQVLASHPYDFGASYNESLGFPIAVAVDPQQLILGDEFRIDITTFTANTP